MNRILKKIIYGMVLITLYIVVYVIIPFLYSRELFYDMLGG